MTICSAFSPVIMDNLYVLLDKAKPLTYILDLSFLSTTQGALPCFPHFSLIIDSLLSNGFFLTINKCTVFSLPLKKPPFCWFHFSSSCVLFLFSSLQQSPKKKAFIHLISNSYITIFSWISLHELLLLPLHHNHFYQYHLWPQVFILLDFKQYLTWLSTFSLH